VPVGEGMVEVRVDLLTREYPPHVYGGAGVHVAGLTRVLERTIDVRVHCFDGPRDTPGVFGYSVPADLAGANAALQTFGIDLEMADAVGAVGADGIASDLVHSHTWYANLGGHLAGLLHGLPHVVSAHSLEPLRPWKAEQLGGGYALSSWAEKTAYEGAAAVIAVSGGMREDILRAYPKVDPALVKVVHNGIDLDQWQRPTSDEAVAAAGDTVRRLGIDPSRPSVVFVGRITRQKGLPYFLRAVELLPPDVQVVLCAGAPDTPQIMAEVTGLVEQLRTKRSGVVWIEQMLPRDELIAVLMHGTVFACPSVYEPLGIVNLEAMAVGLPVVGTATGGIPEVIDDGVTGRLVPIDQLQDGTGTPVDPQRFVHDLADALTDVVSNTARTAEWGLASRRRVEDHFTWEAIADRTIEVYRGALA
jgi:alpha-maltose-1-phosphate synthase